MFVLVRGDPGTPRSEVFGLDILAPRHPKLYALIVERLGFSLDPNNAGIDSLYQCCGSVTFWYGSGSADSWF